MTGLDWGTVPAWASAILTSGSLFLGFYILLRDRRREELKEANKVVVWKEESEDQYTVHLLNSADRTISNATVLVLFLYEADDEAGIEDALKGFAFQDGQVVRSGTEVTVDVPRRTENATAYIAAVTFRDADGYKWIRDMDHYVLHGGVPWRRAPRPKSPWHSSIERARRRRLRLHDD